MFDNYFLFCLELHNKEKMWEQKYIDQQRLYEHSERQVVIELFLGHLLYSKLFTSL